MIALSNSGPRDYPRVCGGAQLKRIDEARYAGLSPRMRGSHPHPAFDRHHVGIIPAYAGEPTRPPASGRRPQDYPRVCGGVAVVPFCVRTPSGLSPRMRGSPSVVLPGRQVRGIIPAYAGEPADTDDHRPATRDYPRVCGGADNLVARLSPGEGLSPRMRGSLPTRTTTSLRHGIIPAYAGEPTIWWRACRRARDYPRVCGGAHQSYCRVGRSAGLFPRMRGSLDGGQHGLAGEGIIPAYAGEPSSC